MTRVTRFAIRGKIIKINKKMGARVYAHARKGFIGTLVTGKNAKVVSEPLKSSLLGVTREV